MEALVVAHVVEVETEVVEAGADTHQFAVEMVTLPVGVFMEELLLYQHQM